MNLIKRLFRYTVSAPGLVPRLLRGSDTGVIFMLHRFPDPELGNEAAHDVEELRDLLGHLRRRRFELVSLETMFDRARDRAPLNGAIAFTIDDGYHDHASVGAPLFAEFDCPVTTFVTSGFLDGAIWFWWDQIDHVFRTTTHRRLSASVTDAGPTLGLEWNNDTERNAARDRFTNACKAISEDEKKAAIMRLAALAEVEIPAHAPRKYSPMSWADARRCEASGMSFGPHTVSHPILARASDAQSRFEIKECWRRLQQEIAHPVPIFCYPNGQPGDFGTRETRTLAEVGLRGAVVGSRGYAKGDTIREEEQRFFVRRFAMPSTRADLIQYVTGLERVKEIIRAEK
jgi:peptidoglycan/xylan/chitin deacetylase (PgdA/CDA1 family)